MNRLTAPVWAVIAIALGVHLLAICLLPRVIMSRVISGLGDLQKEGAFINAPLATAESRAIVRPSPDLAYSVCVLDLSKGSVRIRVRGTAPYTSLALYSRDTDNYFTMDDRSVDGDIFDLIVIAPDADLSRDLPTGANVVRAPSTKGLALVRRVVSMPGMLPRIDAIREESICAESAN